MFHHRSYDTFHLSESQSEQIKVNETEGRLGFELPMALKEWYARADGIALASRQDTLLPLEKLERITFEGEDYVHFMTENQGVCIWATKIGSLPDPPVIVNVDGRGWQAYCSTFSEAIFCQIWDWQDYAITAWSDAEPPQMREITDIMANFYCLPMTFGWPLESCSFRLQQDTRSLLLWFHPSTCHFNLRAQSASDFQILLDAVQNITDVLKRLDSNNSVAIKLINEMKNKP